MAGNTVRMALDNASWERFSRQLQELEKVAKKQVQDAALQAGGDVLKDEANANAPGPYVIAEVASGRTLKKKKKSVGVKGNSRVVAVGADAEHWYYRYAEYGAKPHDVQPREKSALFLYGLSIVTAFAKMSGGIREFAFLRRAFSSKGNLAIKTMGDVLAKEIEKVMRA